MKTDLQRLHRLNEVAVSSSAVSYRFKLPADLSRELLRLANNSNLSLYVIFEAALRVLLHQYDATTFKAHLLEVRKQVLRAYASGRRFEFKISTRNFTLQFDRIDLQIRGLALSDAYDPEGVVKQFIGVLKSIAPNVDIAIDDLTLAIQSRFSRGPERDITARLTHRLFAEQVARTPLRIAVSYGNEKLTYAELDAQSNHLAGELQRRGVKPEVIVPVLMRRNPSLLITMLALFKCGGVYLPLDPQQPAARLTQIVSDSRSPLVLGAREFAGVLEAPMLFIEDLPETRNIDVSRKGAKARREQTTPVPLRSQVETPPLRLCSFAGNLAYLIYTSGSTGAPKGAMLEQRGLFNHLDAKVVDLELTESDVVAQTASQCFDVSIWQFLAALIAGGQVRIIPDEIVKEPAQLLAELARESVSVLEVVPSQLRAILQTIELTGAQTTDLSSLRCLLVTGEALPTALCRQWLELFPATPLVNAYGPTECSDDVTHHFIYKAPLANGESTPIGRPIQNTQVYVLDRELRPVAAGVSGEIYVGGAGVGRGYLHDAKRTAAVYLPDPFSQEPGARLYYTGDLGCYLPDGNLQFNGRRDHQVKVRGFRIELGEIETALRAHPDVDDAAVLTFADGPTGSRLIAYLGCNGREHLGPKELRQFVRGKLPEHMVPSQFVILDKLPLNRNGKVDRGALPVPEPFDRREADDFIPPSTDVEKTLATIWQRNLKLAEVSLGDNFFDLGGNSLLSIQVLNQIRAELIIDLPMKVLLESPTLGDLANEVSQLLPAEITEQCRNNVTAFATQR